MQEDDGGGSAEGKGDTAFVGPAAEGGGTADVAVAANENPSLGTKRSWARIFFFLYAQYVTIG